MKFKKGDEVVFIDEVGGGTVLDIQGASLMVLDGDGFERWVGETKVVLKAGVLNMDVVVDDSITEQARRLEQKPEQAIPKKLKVKAAPPVYDLHIHQLVSDERGLSNHEIVSIQLAHLKKILVEMEAEKERRAIIVHGVGKGVLKEQIRIILAETPGCDYEDADFRKFGKGATEIFFSGAGSSGADLD